MTMFNEGMVGELCRTDQKRFLMLRNQGQFFGVHFPMAGFAILLLRICCFSDIIPADRRIDWSAVGVPGGIPSRTTIYMKIDSATYGKGTVDASTAHRLFRKSKRHCTKFAQLLKL